MTTQTVVLLVIAAIVIVALLAFSARRRQRSEELRERFGPEYEHTVHELGGRGKAEDELEARRRRVERLNIRPLPAEVKTQFADRWRTTQARFVDDPKLAIHEADELVGELMQTRGYPMGNFDQRAADISVNHPGVVTNYRAAHQIARRSLDGTASTENLRTAMVHYRALFEELLETPISTSSVPEEEYRARAS